MLSLELNSEEGKTSKSNLILNSDVFVLRMINQRKLWGQSGEMKTFNMFKRPNN